MSARSLVVALSAGLAVALSVSTAGPAGAVPPPPPNPSDSEIEAGHAETRAKAGRVGELTQRLVEAEGRLQRLVDDVAWKLEQANKALVDLAAAEASAAAAQRDARAARAEADAADRSVEDVRRRADAFVAGSYQQGSTIGSISAYLGSASPEDLLARAQLLNAVSGSQLDAIDQMERARVDRANKDAAARGALDQARARQSAAEDARRAAEAAKAAAVRAMADQRQQAQRIEADRAEVERQLTEAQAGVAGLEDQRKRYEEWREAKRREEEAARRAAQEAARRAAEEAARRAAATAARRPAAGAATKATKAPGRDEGAGDTEAAVEAVVARALSQVGVPYSWGGGNADGPTLGIRDGGEADLHGDYGKVGFDCSGLMVYAFAAAGVQLPRFSGYQYSAGERVPLADAARGDMLFWGPGGGQHVALYLGDGMMVEAPYSGGHVQVSSVRHHGIQPYAVRVL
ncbi:NlpC/P60 family protein [Streptoalloteichus hindustanus]|nr:NlpC/P60 family protein [Streptoalloteichus hindustanus]